MNSTMKHAITLVLTLFCLAAGYGFYRANQNDLITSIAFTVGILGIILSVVRQANAKKD